MLHLWPNANTRDSGGSSDPYYVQSNENKKRPGLSIFSLLEISDGYMTRKKQGAKGKCFFFFT